jgi:hypothetical protein
MGCEAKTFNNLSQDVFERLKSKLGENGLNITADSGTIKGPMGIVMEYEWDPENNSLYTKVLEKSFFVPCNQVDSILSKAIKECGG